MEADVAEEHLASMQENRGYACCQLLFVSLLNYSSTLKMEAVCIYVTTVDFQQAAS
jgi:hypothetical protein